MRLSCGVANKTQTQYARLARSWMQKDRPCLEDDSGPRLGGKTSNIVFRQAADVRSVLSFRQKRGTSAGQQTPAGFHIIVDTELSCRRPMTPSNPDQQAHWTVGQIASLASDCAFAHSLTLFSESGVVPQQQRGAWREGFFFLTPMLNKPKDHEFSSGYVVIIEPGKSTMTGNMMCDKIRRHGLNLKAVFSFPGKPPAPAPANDLASLAC
ncbi:hypothetical protein GE09DRAFT_787039 [Coniochaeta sp. 2T2.1]|nr:hypothetical protein GE09DRAFT_787039 [Coniochaeta sp. 2T2.1]